MMMYAFVLCTAILPVIIEASALRYFGPNSGHHNVNFNAGPMPRSDYGHGDHGLSTNHGDHGLSTNHGDHGLSTNHGDHGLSNNHGHLLTASNNAHLKPYGGPQYAYNFLKNNGHSFGYGIDDPVKGAHAEHVQRGEGGVVRGSYVVREADGTPRLVKYVADQTGFRAVVSDRNGITKHGFGDPNAVPATNYYQAPQMSRRSGFMANEEDGQYHPHHHDNGQYQTTNDNGQYVSTNDNRQYAPNNYDNGQYNPALDNAGQYMPTNEMPSFPGVVGYGYQFAP